MKLKKVIFGGTNPEHNSEQQQLENKSQIQNKKIFRFSIPTYSKVVAGVGICLVLLFIFSIFGALTGLGGNLPKQLMTSVADVFGQELQKDEFGRTNIILMGVGGGTHEGPDLTDTLMLASIDYSANSVSLLSIPRDLYVNVPRAGGMKINAVYDYGLGKKNIATTSTQELKQVTGDTESAVALLSDTVAKVTGVQAQYYIKVDFQGFVDIVNQVGGIEVDVPENFIDRQYPDDNFGYTTFFLRAGRQTLDGATALKYARSRHSTSDFDRARRQQEIMAALREKAMQKEILTDPAKLKRLYYTLSQNLSTNMSIRELLKGASIAANLPKDHITTMVLHDDPTKKGGLLYTPSRDLFGGASVLLPTGATVGNVSYYKDIQLFTQLYFSAPDLFVNPPKIKVFNATMRNGRRATGIATRMSLLLNRYGIEIESAKNFPKGLSSEQTRIVYADSKWKEKVIPSIELLISGKVEQMDAEKSTSVSEVPSNSGGEEDAPETISEQDMIKYSLASNDIVIVIGNDFSDYLSAAK